MISSSDVPACPACGSREVHPVKKRADDPVLAHTTSLQTFYACRQCGRDVTQAWEAVQPAKRPEPEPVIADSHVPEDPETIHEAAMKLGICAELKT